MAAPTHPGQAVDEDGHGIVDSRGRPVMQQPSAPPAAAPVREREVIVTNDGGRRSGFGGALAAVLAIVAIVIVVVVALNLLGDADTGSLIPEDVNVDIDVPDGGGEAPAEPAPEG